MDQHIPSEPPADAPGIPASVASDRFGPFRALSVLGEGGMGLVYEAEQQEPVRRRVALKVIQNTRLSNEILARFEQERQALAVMAHQHIAKVLEAGTSAAGVPYFAMELVNGPPITRYCDDRQLSLRDRIKLFVAVCQGVEHAHQKGVIHRDLKPSNILVADVDGAPAPKIIDFGIAKAMGQRLTDRTLETLFGQVMGTPAYMSPEQAEMTGLDVDTRADVYSLGVVLYEMLVGRLPVDPGEVGLPGFIAHLVDQDTVPSAPSAGLALDEGGSRVAWLRRTDPRELQRHMRVDLDWIVMKAIHHDRDLRYATVGALASDLRHYLAAEPVTARPPSTAYRLGRFARRNRLGVGIAAVLALVLLGSAVVSTMQARRIARERDRALAVTDFLQRILLAPSPIEGQGRDVRMTEALDSSVAWLQTTPVSSPLTEAAIRQSIGWAYNRLGRFADAEPLLRRSLELREQAGASRAEIAESMHLLGQLYVQLANLDSATSYLTRALALRRRAFGDRDTLVAASLLQLGVAYNQQRTLPAAESVLAEAAAIYGAHRDRRHMASVASARADLAYYQERLEEAEQLYREALALQRELPGEHPVTAATLNSLGAVLDNLGRRDEAESVYVRALGIARRAFGERHDWVTATMNNLGVLLERKGDIGGAEQYLRQATANDSANLGGDHPAVAIDRLNLASMLCRANRSGDGAPVALQAVRVMRAQLGDERWETGTARMVHADCQRKNGRYAEAESELLAVLPIMIAALGEHHRRADTVRLRLAQLYEAWGRPARAAPYRQALARPRPDSAASR